MKSSSLRGLAVLVAPLLCSPIARGQSDWATSVKFPKSETPAPLFNGSDLTGWEGQTAKYWSVKDRAIRGANEGPVAASTYLFTRKSCRNFRLLLEVKQSRGEKFSTTHSAVAILGEKMEDHGDPFSFKGPLVMFCNDWGIWDANRRNRIFPAGHAGTLQESAEKVGDWNRIEVLVLGDHIRMAANGHQIIDFVDKPGMLKSSPIGLQLHANQHPEEYYFRGILLAENPEDHLITLEPELK